DPFEVRGDQAGLLAELAPGGGLGGLVERPAPLRDFPGVGGQCVAVLANEPDIAVLLDRKYAEGAVLEGDDAVNAGLCVGAEDAILPEGDPGVFIDGARVECGPRIGLFIWMR